jgi:hypothetical protein
MAGRLLLATAIAFAAGCAAVGLYEVKPTSPLGRCRFTDPNLVSQLQAIVGVYEYNTKREPEKRSYEHSNHSDETLVDSNHESMKLHEARIVSHVHYGRPADPPRRFMIHLPLNTRLQLQALV